MNQNGNNQQPRQYPMGGQQYPMGNQSYPMGGSQPAYPQQGYSEYPMGSGQQYPMGGQAYPMGGQQSATYPQQGYTQYPTANGPQYPMGQAYPMGGYRQPQAYQPAAMQKGKAKARGKRSILLLIAGILGIIFVAVALSAILGVDKQLSTTANTAEEAGRQLGTVIGAALMIPQLVVAVLAVIFNIVAYFMNSKGFALTIGILYTVAAVLFLVNAPFLIPSIVLSFVAYSRLKKSQ